MNSGQAAKGWEPLLRQWGKDLRLLLFITVTLQLFRLLLIAVFREQMVAGGADNLLAVVGMGLRFDVSTAAIWTLPTFLLAISTAFLRSAGWVERLRRWVAVAYALVATLAFGIDLVYFDEYGDQFNQQLFGIIHDDTRAILVTVWKEYHPLLFLAVTLPALVGAALAARRFVDGSPPLLAPLHGHRSAAGRAAITFCLLLAMVAAGRGGTLSGEPIRIKHAFVADDLFLNRTVVNPLSALRYAVETYGQTRSRAGLTAIWPSGDIRAAARTVAGREPEPDTDLDGLMATTARGDGARQRPRHVFLVLIESHSGWPLMPAYRSVGLSPSLAALADEGVYFEHFLPAGHGTAPSLNGLVTGFPNAGLNINYEPNTLRGAYPSAIAAQFKRLGYRTRFFYGGFLGWQRLDSLATAQGFDELYGGGDMSAGADTNEWGVNDSYLFDFVQRKVDDATPSFNFILTTSNHPPYDLDLAALGYPLTALPEPLKATKAETVKVLGHLWYSDLQAGRFVREATTRLTAPLFAITGDHTSRLQIRFPGDSVAEQYAVPFILYGPDVLPAAGLRPATAGSHLDIPPTLVELAAPAGFRYVTFGRDLLAKPAGSYAHGHQFIVGEGVIATDTQPPTVYRFPGASGSADSGPIAAAVPWFQAWRALSWYRVRHGARLPGK